MRAIQFVRAAMAICMLIGTLTKAAFATQLVTVDLTGTIGFTGYDTTGVFGQPNTVLDGVPYSARFIFDLDIGSRAIGPNSDELIGGPAVGLAMPLLSATMTVNGVTAAYTLNGWAYMTTQHGAHGGPPNDFYLGVEFYSPPLRDDQFLIAIASETIVPSLSSSYYSTDISGGGQFQFRTDDASQASFISFAQGQLNVATLRYLVAGAVPEPGSAVLALVGLAFLAVRRGVWAIGWARLISNRRWQR